MKETEGLEVARVDAYVGRGAEARRRPRMTGTLTNILKQHVPQTGKHRLALAGGAEFAGGVRSHRTFRDPQSLPVGGTCGSGCPPALIKLSVQRDNKGTYVPALMGSDTKPF